MFQTQIRRFLSLILDLDVLLGTNRMFRLGNWTQTARKAAAEVQGATTATPDWYELYNARQLITTWGGRDASERAGLRDYSYRQWQGMLSDFYYPRWQYYFSHGLQAICRHHRMDGSRWNGAGHTMPVFSTQPSPQVIHVPRQHVYSKNTFL